MRGFEKFLKYMKTSSEKIADAIFPIDIYCIVCEKPISSDNCYSLCDDCLNTLHWANERTCKKCGRVLEDWYPAELCGECTNREHHFDEGITCLQYKDEERRLIHDFKYHKKSYLSRIFADIFHDKINVMKVSGDIIIPVPMYAAKERKRGYNQSDLIALFLSKKLNTLYSKEILLRIKDTVPMNKLGRKERWYNLNGAFYIPENKKSFIKGKDIILIDDIYTTGVTADKCSKILKASGAGNITVITLAAGRNQRKLPDIVAYKYDRSKKYIEDDKI